MRNLCAVEKSALFPPVDQQIIGNRHEPRHRYVTKCSIVPGRFGNRLVCLPRHRSYCQLDPRLVDLIEKAVVDQITSRKSSP